mmetsp:Transcript_27194/g.78378  ORF Transcript_27194/g.78378 Transcript_27194/m.78378 type:complete len:363 (+) Transcript_27194:2126-3214(+)
MLKDCELLESQLKCIVSPHHCLDRGQHIAKMPFLNEAIQEVDVWHPTSEARVETLPDPVDLWSGLPRHQQGDAAGVHRWREARRLPAQAGRDPVVVRGLRRPAQQLRGLRPPAPRGQDAVEAPRRLDQRAEVGQAVARRVKREAGLLVPVHGGPRVNEPKQVPRHVVSAVRAGLVEVATDKVVGVPHAPHKRSAHLLRLKGTLFGVVHGLVASAIAREVDVCDGNGLLLHIELDEQGSLMRAQHQAYGARDGVAAQHHELPCHSLSPPERAETRVIQSGKQRPPSALLEGNDVGVGFAQGRRDVGRAHPEWEVRVGWVLIAEHVPGHDAQGGAALSGGLASACHYLHGLLLAVTCLGRRHLL